MGLKEIRLITLSFYCLYIFTCQPVVAHRPHNIDDFANTWRVRSCRSVFKRPAICVPLDECEPLVKLLKNNPTIGRRVIGSSACSLRYNRLIVCCPQIGEPQSGGSGNGSNSNINTDNNNNNNNKNNNNNSGSTNNGGGTVKEKEPTTGRPVEKPLYPPRCGRSNVPHDRVVGGSPASPGAWPWIANVGYGNRFTNLVSFRCGGTLISPRHVVTAGHCVKGQRDLRLVRLGEHNLASSDNGASPIDVLIDKVVVHPDFNENTLENDIAILRLNKEIEFNEMISPICLPLSDSIRNRNLVSNFPFVAGWGSTSFKGPNSNVLREAQVPVVDTQQCKQSYRRVKNTVIDGRVLCAGYAQGGKDACQGDSGGPLMLPQKKTYYLIGVISGGYRCAEPGFPGIYTKVTSFLDFILTNMD